MVTENALDDEYEEMYEDYITPDERLEDHWWMLNAILSDCGMPPLDPRNAEIMYLAELDTTRSHIYAKKAM